MQPLALSPDAKKLAEALEAADAAKPKSGQTFHVAELGQGFYFAYEQLRNITEYREHHLLLRSAIERYLARYVRLNRYEPIADDMVTELTQAGYLKNDSIPLAAIKDINDTLTMYSAMYQTLQATKRLDRHTTAKWFYQIASVQIEGLLSPDPRNAVFMQFAYEHYYEATDHTAAGEVKKSDAVYRIALFCAVQRAIFKSDLATIRYYCVTSTLPDLLHQPIQHFVELNQHIDDLYQAPITNRLFRLINRYGAPMRIIRKLVMEGSSFKHLLENRHDTLDRIRMICAHEYNETHKGLSARIGKTILFIFITKVLLGVSIEVPYDMLIHGAIAWTPLIINICFPVLYMTTIGARISTPGRHNTEVISGYAERIFYENAGAPVVYKTKRRVKSKSLNRGFSVVYAVAFIGSIALLVQILRLLHFNLANGLIFFVFFCAVSFLGFRLRQSAHELQVLDEQQGLLSALIDFLSTPFVRVGHWISDKYAKVNIITRLLDLAIEMPLKTSLRLVRQWVGFLRDKQEEL